jgi:hypothetical protein
MSRSSHHRGVGTFTAFALIAAGLTGVIVDNNGKVGLALFVAGAGGVLFLIGRQLARSVGPKLHRPHLAARGSISSLVRGRTVAVAVVAMGVLLSATNVFKASDSDSLSRAVNYLAWYGFLLIAISLVSIGVATGVRRLARPTTVGR